jgi:hypothetical protein
MRLFRVSELTGARMLRDAEAVYETITEPVPSIELGEAWPAFHMVLTAGDAPMPRDVAIEEGVEWDDTSLENVLMGGEATPYEDGLSVARVLPPAAVRALSTELDAESPETLAGRVDEEVLGLAPSGWDRARTCEEVVAQYHRVADFYRTAAASGQGLLIYVP